MAEQKAIFLKQEEFVSVINSIPDNLRVSRPDDGNGWMVFRLECPNGDHILIFEHTPATKEELLAAIQQLKCSTRA